MMKLLRRHGDLLALGALVLVYAIWPGLDFQLAFWFYEKNGGFAQRMDGLSMLVYHSFSEMWVLAVFYLLLLLLSIVPRFAGSLARQRKLICYLLLALLIGGLTVESVKMLWGRARPAYVVEFGGNQKFTPALQPSGECRVNCAFVSGHAASGFYLMSLYWVTRRRRWLFAGIALGIFLGYLRMRMGGHWLSDVLFAGFLVHGVCRELASVFRLPAPGKNSQEQGAAPRVLHQ